MKQKDHILLLVRGAIFAALIFVATRFLSIPLPGVGYVHLGDALLFVAATLLPMPYAIGAAIIGAGLADLTAGFAVYLPATILIKGLTAALFTSQGKRMLCLRNLLALPFALLLCAGGYFIFEWALYGLSAATPSIPFNCLQILASAVIYLPIATVLDHRKLHLK